MQLERLGRLPEAIAAYEGLLAHTPNLPDCWYNLALLQRRTGRYQAALASYAQALAHGIRGAEQAHLNRGVIFADCLHDAPAAQRELEAALALNPRYLPALQNLANLYEDLGRREEARSLYERILGLEPNAAVSLARYANLTQISGPRDPVIQQLRAAIGRASSADQASLGFALVRALDACGQYAEAFAAAQAANAASLLSVTPAPRYDRAAQERLVDELIRAFPAPPGAGSTAAPTVPQPIFICGMFRSGSTLTEQAAQRSPAARRGRGARPAAAPGEGAPRALPRHHGLSLAGDARAARRRVPRGPAPAVPRRRLGHGQAPGQLPPRGAHQAGCFRGRASCTRTRDALDTCLSIFFLHLDQRMSYALDLMDIGHYYRQYRRLMASLAHAPR